MGASSYLELAADDLLWSNPEYQAENPTPDERMGLALINLASAAKVTLPLASHEPAFGIHDLNFHHQPWVEPLSSHGGTRPR